MALYQSAPSSRSLQALIARPWFQVIAQTFAEKLGGAPGMLSEAVNVLAEENEWYVNEIGNLPMQRSITKKDKEGCVEEYELRVRSIYEKGVDFHIGQKIYLGELI